jgi:hypothetical protein
MTQSRTFDRKLKMLFVVLLVATSIITWYISYRSGLAVVYNDAMSHLNIGRAVLDGKQPGLAQLGSVWLPLNHILELTLVWNDWAWHSGFAGSFFSMLAYIFSAIGIYKIVKELTKDFWASILGALAFAMNPNILYLQTTPLTEPLYLVFFIFSALFTIKFIKTSQLKHLLLMGVFGALQVLTRYDGWFVVGIEGLILIYHQFFVVKVKFQEFLGKFLIFSMPIIFSALLWLLWNALIFGSPLYFMFGPYSAHAQQLVIQSNQGLPTKGHLYISILAYWYSVSANIGNYMILLASLGLILFFITKNNLDGIKHKLMVFLILFAPILFNIIALYLGFSILNLPQLHYQLSSDFSQEYFNVRYGILTLPFVAVFVGLLAEKITKKIFLLAIFLILIAQAAIIYQQGIVTIMDGVLGSSNVMPVANILAENVKSGENVLISSASFSSIVFRSGFPIKDFITEGDSAEWKSAIAAPQNYADWVVMGNGDPNDGVYVGVFKNNSEQFLKNYINVYCNVSTCVYKKRTPAETFVYTEGTNLKVDNSNFVVNGVNSYDLAYQSTSTIDATFKNLSGIGVNTVRFWMFGDGNPDGFQPISGIPNEARFENADFAIADAANYNIRLIPVLVNNWTDYGGEQQYLKWTGKDPNNQDLFYTDPETIALFENYINHVIPRKNTVNGITYSDDPTIMAWEVVNEPRFSASDTTAFINWFSGVASYIRQEDPNHMITVETDTTSVGKNGQFTIQDNCATLAVDFCTAHLYLYNGTKPIYNSLSTVQSNVQQYIQLANTDNKPLILGEVGISKTTTPFGEQPLDVLKNILGFNSGDSGALIWNWSQASDTSYGFSPAGSKGIYTLADLSNVLGDKQPTVIDYTNAKAPAGGAYAISTPGTGPTPAPTSTPQPIVAPPASDESAVTTVPLASPTPTPAPPAQPAPTPTAAPAPTQPTPLSLPYSTSTFTASDWGNGWGGLTSASGTLIVGADSQNTSGGLFLNNSASWQNYTFAATANWVKGQIVTLVARRNDGNDFLQCEFQNTGEIDVNRIYNGQQVQLGQGYAPNFSISSNVQLSAKVNGDQIECGLNGSNVPNYINWGMPPQLLQGGIGFTTWDPTPGNSEIIVKNISVTPIY